MVDTEKDSTSPIAIDLVPLEDVATEVQLKILDIRNEDDVRKWMYVDTPIGINEHLHWIKQDKNDDSQLVFVVMENQTEALGVIKVTRINRLHKSAEWAFFLTREAKSGIGPAIEYAFLDFVFEKLDIEKLNCEVIEGNDGVVKLHKKFLFREEGFRHSNIIKNGARIGVHFLGLSLNEWLSGRKSVLEKYQKSLNRFAVTIQWDGLKSKAEKLHPIDEIESARAKNNLNWMNILRLVLELSPEHGRTLVADIRKIDKEISALTDKLLEQ